jgi:hypothetical protein
MEWSWGVAALVALAILFWIILPMRERLHRIERKLSLLLKHHGIESSLGPPLSEQVKELARNPSLKIMAIKAYREETGVGLAEAKAAVEEYIDSL